MLLPALAKAKKKASQTGCMSNFRQVNVALIMWTDDNSGWLPPGSGSTSGLYDGQQIGYNNTTPTRLSYFLPSYMGFPDPGANWYIPKSMFCPGYAQGMRTASAPTNDVMYFLSNENVDNSSVKLTFYPFGLSLPSPTPPHKLSDVQAQAPLTSVWYLADVDDVAYPASRWPNPSAPKPVHGSVRNYLYFDGHAGVKKVNPAGGM
jgi:prepilin-type processing-associated H-X9-DG protein